MSARTYRIYRMQYETNVGVNAEMATAPNENYSGLNIYGESAQDCNVLCRKSNNDENR
jgi:hypothetical protein